MLRGPVWWCLPWVSRIHPCRHGSIQSGALREEDVLWDELLTVNKRLSWVRLVFNWRRDLANRFESVDRQQLHPFKAGERRTTRERKNEEEFWLSTNDRNARANAPAAHAHTQADYTAPRSAREVHHCHEPRPSEGYRCLPVH